MPKKTFRPPNLVAMIRSALAKDGVSMTEIARETRIGYDTIWRISRDESYDPGWSKVWALANHILKK